MTVCIAAACISRTDERRSFIVLCCDSKISSGLGSSEGHIKHIFLKHDWYGLTAGDEPDIVALRRLYISQFKRADAPKFDTIDAAIKEPLYKRKAELAEEYVQTRFGLSYDYFLRNGKAQFSTEHFYGAQQAIAHLPMNASLILAGFIDSAPEIYYTDNDGKARAALNYAIVGEGEYVAHASLLRRGQTDHTYLDTTIYNVFEAKTLAENVPSVGKDTMMSVLDEDGNWKIISDEYKDQLKEWFKQYGPQPIIKATFEGNMFYEPPKKEEG